MSARLTRPQWELLAFLRTYIGAHDGMAPSYDEMRAAMGWATKSHIARHLNAMDRGGFIVWRPKKHRSIELCSVSRETGSSPPNLGRAAPASRPLLG